MPGSPWAEDVPVMARTDVRLNFKNWPPKEFDPNLVQQPWMEHIRTKITLSLQWRLKVNLF